MPNFTSLQLMRFQKVENLTNYVCNATYVKAGENFEPTCEFPFVNSGWAMDGDPGMDDVILGDCSITYSDASGGIVATSSLLHSCLYGFSIPMLTYCECRRILICSSNDIYYILNIPCNIPHTTTVIWVYRARRLKHSHTSPFSFSEEICAGTLFIAICAFISAIDLYAYGNKYSYLVPCYALYVGEYEVPYRGRRYHTLYIERVSESF